MCLTEVTPFYWYILFPLYDHTNIYLSSLSLMDICCFLFFKKYYIKHCNEHSCNVW